MSGLRIRFNRGFFAATLISLGLASHAQADTALRAQDSLGRTVQLTAAPQRIVTIFSSNTEIVAALGLSDRIVGIDAYTYYPPQIKNKPQIGGRLGFSIDRIVAQRPDLVIMTPARQATHQLMRPLDLLGIPVVVLNSRDIDEVLHNILLVSRLTGTEKRGRALVNDMRQRMARVASQAGRQPAPRVVLLTGRVGNGLLLATRANNYTADILLKAGARLALDERQHTGPQLSQISPEALLSTDPDILLYAGSQRDLDELASMPGWTQMSAVRNGNVHTVPRAELLIPGPRVIEGVERLASIFQQWGRRR